MSESEKKNISDATYCCKCKTSHNTHILRGMCDMCLEDELDRGKLESQCGKSHERMCRMDLDKARFHNGQQLLALFFPGDESVRLGDGEYAAKSITVVMENGERDYVPWAIVEQNSGSVCKYNLARCEGVRLNTDD